MKLDRHSTILRVLREQRVANQDELRRALEEKGMVVAQATLSRDIHELGLIKQADPEGGSFYVIPVEAPARADIGPILRDWITRAEGVGPLLVLHTRPGGAGAVAAALELEAWPEFLGAVASAETVLLVALSEAGRKSIERRIVQLSQA
jgi:transcriptional regulator of arginine metabolism